ncbi:MAG TPA: amidohydrolase family protein, partial [Gemmatimonadaceae bacterium]|nr:amidohydrolase family protein [Gemmatimonadaceae bacterium]
MRRRPLLLFALLMTGARLGSAQRPSYDIVIANGRVIDPETRLDAVRFVGIRGGKIAAISATPLAGETTIDAKGLVVAPGFIDLHAHGQDDENYRVFALDGVTTALELEVGTEDVPAFYAKREGKSLINYGASVGHVRERMVVMKDPSQSLLPTGSGGHQVATEAEIAEIKRRIEAGLAAGALGVGMGLQYTPAASKFEVLEAFRAAAK